MLVDGTDQHERRLRKLGHGLGMADDHMHMKAPNWQNVVSLGNLLSIGTVIVVIAGTWAVFGERLDNTQERLAKVESNVSDIPIRMDMVERQQQVMNTRIDSSFATISERLDRLAEGLAVANTKISAQLSELDKKVAVIQQRMDSERGGK